MDILERIDGLEAKFHEVSLLITDPAVIADQARYVRLNREYRDLERVLASAEGVAELYAEVSNEGRAEGSKYTVVNVYEKNTNLDFGWIVFEKKPFTVYEKRVEAFDELDVKWLNDGMLMVEGTEYPLR